MPIFLSSYNSFKNPVILLKKSCRQIFIKTLFILWKYTNIIKPTFIWSAIFMINISESTDIMKVSFCFTQHIKPVIILAHIYLICNHHHQNIWDHVRCEGFILFCTNVVRVEVEHSNHEGHKHHDEYDHELKDVFHCSSKWYLQRSKAFICW